MSVLLASGSSPLVASGFHAPLIVAIPLVVLVVLLKVVLSRRRGRPALGGKTVVRCRKGHLFTTTWSPLGSFGSIRLGFGRFQHCPVGNHWSLVKPVAESDLSDDERRRAQRDSG